MIKLYRKRIIPDECIELKGDTILYKNNSTILTKWNTLHPKNEFASGISLYLLDNGWKISKLYDSNGNFVKWYCDIIRYDYDSNNDSYVFTDLLADVIIEPDGFVKVVDLDELSDAFEDNKISAVLMSEAIRKVNNLLSAIYLEIFEEYKDFIESYE